MEIEIVKEIETPLLSRKRITAWASFKGPTPSRVEILKEVAKSLKTKEELISIRHIYTRFGYEKVKLIIHVYSDIDTMVRLEGNGLVGKHKPGEKKEKKPAPEVKKEEGKEDKPAEEEKKDEEKPEEQEKKEGSPEEKK